MVFVIRGRRRPRRRGRLADGRGRRDLAGVGDGEVVAPAREARRLLVHEDPVVVGRLEVGRERQRDDTARGKAST